MCLALLMRSALLSILESSPEWDGKVWNLQVTGVTNRALEIRILMSSKDSSLSRTPAVLCNQQGRAITSNSVSHLVP
jgi:hypothetical protein